MRLYLKGKEKTNWENLVLIDIFFGKCIIRPMTLLIEAAKRVFHKNPDKRPHTPRPQLNDRVQHFLSRAVRSQEEGDVTGSQVSYGLAASLAKRVYEGYSTDFLFGFQAEERGLHAVVSVTALISAGETAEAVAYASYIVDADRLLPPTTQALLRETIRENSTSVE